MGSQSDWASGAWSGGGWGSTSDGWGAGDWSSQNTWHDGTADRPAESVSEPPGTAASNGGGTVREEMARLRSEASKVSTMADGASSGAVFAVSSDELMAESGSTVALPQASSWPPSGSSDTTRQGADVRESNQLWSFEEKMQSWGNWPHTTDRGWGSSCDNKQDSESKAGNTTKNEWQGERCDDSGGGEAREEGWQHDGSAATHDEPEGAQSKDANVGDDEKRVSSREEDRGEGEEERSDREDDEAAHHEDWEESQTAAARRRQLERMKAEEESRNAEEEIQKDWHQKWLRRQQQHSQPIRVVESLPGVTAPLRPAVQPIDDALGSALDGAEVGAESGAEGGQGEHAETDGSSEVGGAPAGAERGDGEDPRLREEWYQKWLQRSRDRPSKMIEIGLDAGMYTAADLEGRWGGDDRGPQAAAPADVARPSPSARTTPAAPSTGGSQGGWGESSWTGSTWSVQGTAGRGGGHEWYRQWLKDAKKKPGPPPREMQRAAGW